MRNHPYWIAFGSWLAVMTLSGCSAWETTRLPQTLLPGLGSSGPSLEGAMDPTLQAATAAEQAGDFEQALIHYRQLNERYPEEVAFLHRRAVLEDMYGDAEASAKWYLQAVRLQPQDPHLLTDYGYSRYVQGDLMVAESMLKQAIALAPEYHRAHNNLALVWARQGKKTEALAAFQQGGLSAEQAADNLLRADQAAQLSRSSTPGAGVVPTS